MIGKINRIVGLSVAASIVAFAAQAARAQDFFLHHDGYADVQVDGNTAYATAAGEWWFEIPPEIEPWFDGGAIWVMWYSDRDGVLGGDEWDPFLSDDFSTVPATIEISRDGNDPTVVPIAWQAQLSSGWHRLRLVAWAYGSNGWDWPYWGGEVVLADVTVYVP